MSEKTWRLVPPDITLASVLVQRGNDVWETAIGEWDPESSSIRLSTMDGPLSLKSGDTVQIRYTDLVQMGDD